MKQVLTTTLTREELATFFENILINVLKQKQSNSQPLNEIIDRQELQKRLSITEPTIIRWERKGKIPSLRIGGSVRYNWPAVIDALENKKKSGGPQK